ncbi:MAG TPA: GNAT family N-acetyltransferase [Thermomicrobiales bacterium]|jgi:GNAT superfamily N-acetyltransferase
MRDERFVLEPLGAQHERAAFASEVAALDRYFREQAGQDMRRRAAVVYVLVERESAASAGFYTLSATGVDVSAFPTDVARRLPRYPRLPAVLLGRLAVDRRFRGQGLGRGLLLDALARGYHLSRQIGALAVVVEAKDDDARRFYTHFGFRQLADADNRLFLEMATIAELGLPEPR